MAMNATLSKSTEIISFYDNVKVELKENLFLVSFSTKIEMKHFENLVNFENVIFSGHWSEVSEEFAKQVVDTAVPNGNFFKDYCKPDRALLRATDSIKSALYYFNPFIIIYE